MKAWERVLFMLGLMALAYAGGIATGKYQLWPYGPLNEAKDAAEALWITYFPDEIPEFNSPFVKGGVTRFDPERAQDGFTFIPLRDNEGMGAILVDMRGRVLHRWSLSFSDVFPGDAPHIISRASDDHIAWHGVQLFPNGDVLLNLEGGNFPFGSGLVLIDRDSRIKWKVARNTHHALEVQPDGTIVVLAHEFLPDGVPACNGYVRTPYLADRLLTVSSDGRELDSFSLAEAFCKSPYRWMMMPFGTYSLKGVAKPDIEDLQHTNDIEVIRPDQTAVFPMGKAGDYLVSFRNLNLLAVVDRETRLIKWALAGQFVRQHDPDILANGHILLFDNLGATIEGARPQGRSRVIELDPLTQRIVWKYEGGTDPHDVFDAPKGGSVQKLPNGNVLITHGWQGRVIEVTGDPEPRIVWEYVNVIRSGEGGGYTGLTTDAARFLPGELPFLDAPQS